MKPIVRKIVKIDEEKCTGCGQCVTACAEGAIEIIDGKAKVVSEVYCDGLGACLGTCPEGAITIEEREAEPFDEEAAKAHVAAKGQAEHYGGTACPGSAARSIDGVAVSGDESTPAGQASQLASWPVQLKLVPPNAPYFQDADLLLVADCVPFAMGDFHSRLLRGRPVVVGCPKLDDPDFYIEKLSQILTASLMRSLTIVHMEVPCCFGLQYVAEQALARSQSSVSVHDVTVGISGEVRKEA